MSIKYEIKYKLVIPSTMKVTISDEEISEFKRKNSHYIGSIAEHNNIIDLATKMGFDQIRNVMIDDDPVKYHDNIVIEIKQAKIIENK